MSVILMHQRAKKIKVETDMSVVNSSGEIELRSGCNFGVNFSNDKEHCLATIREKIESVEYPESFFIEIEIEGEFETDRIESEDDKRNVHVESYYALFPYAQQLVAQLSMAAGVAPIMIRPEKMKKEDVHFGKEDTRQ